MKKIDILRVWGCVLRGHTPFLSVEITKECPLKCPGCYAYSPEHLGSLVTLRQLSDYRGVDLVTATLAVVRRLRPVHVSIVGGEPLVRYRELCEILPVLDQMGVEAQLVTSAVRPIPHEWKSIPSLHLVVSIDGLPAEHDVRRTPATYDRILKHIAGHRITVHCTVTRPMLARPGYLADFCRFWSDRPEARQNLVQHLYAAAGRSIAGTLAAAGPRNPPRRIVRRYPVSESALAAVGTRWLSQSAPFARGVYLRAAHHQPFGRPEDSRHAMPVGRQARL